MDMAVHKVYRPELSDKPVKAFKTAVARIFHIVNMAGGCMCEKYIYISAVPDFVYNERKRHTKETEIHVTVGVLVKSVVVSERTGNTRNEQRRLFMRSGILKRKCFIADNAETCIYGAVAGYRFPHRT